MASLPLASARRLGWTLKCRAMAATLLLSAATAFPIAAIAGQGANANAVTAATLPPEVSATLARIRQGGPFPYRQDGASFGNREHRLPMRAGGYYREYTVVTPGARDRGARRIIAGHEGEYYYSDDHYRSFHRIRE
jgi:ribonuclease T1